MHKTAHDLLPHFYLTIGLLLTYNSIPAYHVPTMFFGIAGFLWLLYGYKWFRRREEE